MYCNEFNEVVLSLCVVVRRCASLGCSWDALRCMCPTLQCWGCVEYCCEWQDPIDGGACPCQCAGKVSVGSNFQLCMMHSCTGDRDWVEPMKMCPHGTVHVIDPCVQELHFPFNHRPRPARRPAHCSAWRRWRYVGAMVVALFGAVLGCVAEVWRSMKLHLT